MKRAMISMPMGGKSKQEIDEVFNRAKTTLEGMGYDVAETRLVLSEKHLKQVGVKNIPLAYLAYSLEVMSEVDAVYFVSGWTGARGCRIEYEAAYRYGLKIIGELGEEAAAMGGVE